jgi:acetyl esterase/lipase
VLGVSPWFPVNSKLGTARSYEENRASDILSPEGSREFGQIYAKGVPDSRKPHFDFVSTPKEWFKGFDSVVDRILMTVGDKEVLRDDILEVAKMKIAENHSDTTTILQEFGVHNDVFFDVTFGVDPLTTKLTIEILEWLEAVFS